MKKGRKNIFSVPSNFFQNNFLILQKQAESFQTNNGILWSLRDTMRFARFNLSKGNEYIKIKKIIFLFFVYSSGGENVKITSVGTKV